MLFDGVSVGGGLIVGAGKGSSGCCCIIGFGCAIAGDDGFVVVILSVLG